MFPSPGGSPRLEENTLSKEEPTSETDKTEVGTAILTLLGKINPETCKIAALMEFSALVVRMVARSETILEDN
ncbi:hypothetical protein RUM44_012336 [Polyplax serrata]|uniref:Uncharacterized protein n=1 Tax=Polyplax serrata TaxID=468196 RepID=A0ABR1BFG1_POLSC